MKASLYGCRKFMRSSFQKTTCLQPATSLFLWFCNGLYGFKPSFISSSSIVPPTRGQIREYARRPHPLWAYGLALLPLLRGWFGTSSPPSSGIWPCLVTGICPCTSESIYQIMNFNGHLFCDKMGRGKKMISNLQIVPFLTVVLFIRFQIR